MGSTSCVSVLPAPLLFLPRSTRWSTREQNSQSTMQDQPHYGKSIRGSTWPSSSRWRFWNSCHHGATLLWSWAMSVTLHSTYAVLKEKHQLPNSDCLMFDSPLVKFESRFYVASFMFWFGISVASGFKVIFENRCVQDASPHVSLCNPVIKWRWTPAIIPHPIFDSSQSDVAICLAMKVQVIPLHWQEHVAWVSYTEIERFLS